MQQCTHPEEGWRGREGRGVENKVKGSFYNSGQYQIIFGTGLVNQIYDEVQDLLGDSPAAPAESPEQKEPFSFKMALRVFGDVFVPIIPAIVAAGLFSGLNSLLTQPQILAVLGMPDGLSTNLSTFISVLTGTAFTYLPVLVCWSAFRIFGGSPILGSVLGLTLVNPALPDANSVARGDLEPLMFFGFIPVLGYQSSVLPPSSWASLGRTSRSASRRSFPLRSTCCSRPSSCFF